MYTIKEEREIEPDTFAHLVSSTLYERRFGPYFIEPVMAGISTTPSGKVKPFIAATDLIGCLNFAKDFVVAGTASSKLFGVAEGLWEPDLEPEDLFETISQTMLNAVDRDAYSGWGSMVYVMCVISLLLLCRILTLPERRTRLSNVHSKEEWTRLCAKCIFNSSIIFGQQVLYCCGTDPTSCAVQSSHEPL